LKVGDKAYIEAPDEKGSFDAVTIKSIDGSKAVVKLEDGEKKKVKFSDLIPEDKLKFDADSDDDDDDDEDDEDEKPKKGKKSKPDEDEDDDDAEEEKPKKNKKSGKKGGFPSADEIEGMSKKEIQELGEKLGLKGDGEVLKSGLAAIAALSGGSKDKSDRKAASKVLGSSEQGATRRSNSVVREYTGKK